MAFGPTLVHLEHALGRDAAGAQVARGSLGAEHPEAQRVEPARDGNQVRLVVIVHGDEDAAFVGQRAVRRDLGLGERHPERVGDAHHLAGGPHLRPEHEIHTLQLAEGEHRLLHGDVGVEHVVLQPQVVERLAHHDRGRETGERHAGGLGDERAPCASRAGSPRARRRRRS